jgi:hypothetical protein
MSDQILDLALNKPYDNYTDLIYFLGECDKVNDYELEKVFENAFDPDGGQKSREAAFSFWCNLDENSRLALTIAGYAAVLTGDMSSEAFSPLLAQSWLQLKTRGNLLRRAGISLKDVVEMFEEADPKYLMDLDDEYEVFQKLPNEITVYRGVNNIPASKARYGMSWTLDKGYAAWFAGTYHSGDKPYCLEAVVNKKDVLAYFSQEYEVVVRPGCVSKVRQFSIERGMSVGYADRGIMLPIDEMKGLFTLDGITTKNILKNADAHIDKYGRQ